MGRGGKGRGGEGSGVEGIGGEREGGRGGRERRDDCYTYYNGATIFKLQSRHVLRNNV